jgi:DNA mismatch repair ATPase MutS
MLDESIIKLSNYYSYNPEKSLKSKMILDSQALEHLQVLEIRTEHSITTKGSLLDLIDSTRTPFGKRLLK